MDLSIRYQRFVPAVSLAIPLGLGIITWYALLIGAGIALRITSVSPFEFAPFVIVALLFWPVYAFRPWRSGLDARVHGWAVHYRHAIGLAAALAVLLAGSNGTNLPAGIASVLQLPLRGASGPLYGASVFYRERIGRAAGAALLRIGQWYLEAMWLFLLSAGITYPIRRRQDA